nr:hypothetical protein [uncultured Pseudomonas sp.]
MSNKAQTRKTTFTAYAFTLSVQLQLVACPHLIAQNLEAPVQVDQSIYVHNDLNAIQPYRHQAGPSMESPRNVIEAPLLLWDQAMAAARAYEEAKGHVPESQLEKLRQTAEFLISAASTFQLETMTGSKAPRQ